MDSDSNDSSEYSPTVRDDGSHNRTTRDGSRPASVEDGSDPYRRVDLPPELQEQFEVIRELPGGAEAIVLLVAERFTQIKRVIKLYGKDIVPEEETMRMLETANPEHVVEFKIGALGNFWYEIQEYCEAGSLRDYLTRQGGRSQDGESLKIIIREISSALKHIHNDLSITHRDIKPENIFVRNEEPLDLVLGDFGLARSISSVRLTRAWGTPAYWPPESASGQLSEVSPAWDWWSLGIIIAELSEGHHPFADLLAVPQLISSFLMNNSVPLADIHDERLLMLLRGLLVKDRRERWTSVQVEDWLQGASPPLPSEVSKPTARTVHFGGHDYATSASLATAFQSNWADARGRLFQVRDATLIDETKALCRSEGLIEAVMVLEQPLESSGVARSFSRLLIEMNPALPARYNGLDLTREGLLNAAVAAATSVGVDPVSQVIEELSSLDVLIMWRSLPGVNHGPETNGRWLKKIAEYRAHLSALTRGTGNSVDSELLKRGGVELTATETRAVYAWLLISALQPEEANEKLRGILDNQDTETARQAPWWNQLSESRDDDSALVLAAYTIDKAVQQVKSQRDLDRQRREQRELEAQAQRNRQLEDQRRDLEARQDGERRRLSSYADATKSWACIGFFLWFLFYVGSIVSIVCLVRAIICLNECKRVGIKSPRDNAKAFAWSIAPMIIFPTVVIIGSLTIHGFDSI